MATPIACLHISIFPDTAPERRFMCHGIVKIPQSSAKAVTNISDCLMQPAFVRLNAKQTVHQRFAAALSERQPLPLRLPLRPSSLAPGKGAFRHSGAKSSAIGDQRTARHLASAAQRFAAKEFFSSEATQPGIR